MRTKSLFTPWLWAYAAVLAASLRAMPAFGGPIGSEASARPRGPEEFLVNGSSIPLISEQAGNIGDTWAGYIPVDAHDASRQMFFWLFPRNASSYKRADDSLIIWSPAGQGVSSIRDALYQLGPVLFPLNGEAEFKPERNPYSWVQAANLLFIDQPIGSGFSFGTPNITNDDELAVELMGFLDGFFDRFPTYKTKKIYLAGQGLGGYAMTGLASTMMSQRPDWKYRGLIYINPWIPSLGWSQDVASVKFLHDNAAHMPIADEDLSFIDREAARLKLDSKSVEALLAFPPGPPLPLPSVTISDGRSMWVLVRDAVWDQNPCFSQYDVKQKCPYLFDPWGFRGFQYPPTSRVNLFNVHPELREALHASKGDADFRTHKYYDTYLFPSRNASEPSGDQTPFFADDPWAGDIWTRTAATPVNGRVLVVAGGLNYDQLSFGLLLGMQNITWGGMRGFQQRPKSDLSSTRATSVCSTRSGG